MTLRDMEIFMKVVDCGSMSAAAQELFISQSSVSQVISGIEKDYDVKLFDRLSKKLYITEVGRDVSSYVRHILTTRRSLENYLGQNTLSHNIRIGATITVGTCILSPILLKLGEAIPRLKSEALIANTHILESKLLLSQIDIALVEGQIKHPELICHHAIDDDLVLACGRSHPFFGRGSVNINELVDQCFILREEGSGTRAQLDKELGSRNIPYKVSWSSYSPEAIKKAVTDGHGITVISKLLIQKESKEGLLWYCDIEGLPLKRSFDIVYHKDKYINEEIRRFISVCIDFGQGNDFA